MTDNSTSTAPADTGISTTPVIPAASAGHDAVPIPTPAVKPQTVAEATSAWRKALNAPGPNAAPAPTLADAVQSMVPAESAIVADDAPVQGADGRWRDKDGKFTAAPGTTIPVDATASVVATDPALDPNAAPVDVDPNAAVPIDPAASEPIVVTVKDRNGQPKEIEVTDPEMAEILRANANDGMRRAEFTRQMESIQNERAEYKAFQQMLATNPEEVILNNLPVDAQNRLAEAIIAKNWDALVERIVKMDADPSARTVAAAEAEVRRMRQQNDLQALRVSAQTEAQLERAAMALVPDQVDEATAARFMQDAAQDVVTAIRSGQQVTPANITTLLAPRVALYRFTEAASPTPASAGIVSPPPVSTAPIARPVARAVAAPAQPVTASSTAVDPASAAQRFVQTQAARSVAAAVAPPGAGAASLRVPVVPQGATVEEASKMLRQQAGKSW